MTFQARCDRLERTLAVWREITHPPQPASIISPTGGVIANPNPGGGFYCPTSQPAWSAYRDPSFGTATLTFASPTSATFKWFRTIDGGAVADSVTYTRLAVAAPPPAPPAVKAAVAVLAASGAAHRFAAPSGADVGTPGGWPNASVTPNGFVVYPGTPLGPALSIAVSFTLPASIPAGWYQVFNLGDGLSLICACAADAEHVVFCVVVLIQTPSQLIYAASQSTRRPATCRPASPCRPSWC